MDGSIERLAATGPLLGALAEAVYDQEAVSIAPGDRILLYTDGVTEARQGNMFFGEERVRDVFELHGTDVARALLASVREFVEGDLRDDIAVLALDFRSAIDDGQMQDGRGE
jgi:serine phosphatase RsbU (regulator of sigma subunit)